MALVEVKNIYKTFGKGDGAVRALNGVSMEVDRGEMVAVMGKSGSGKSTLLNILGGLVDLDEGEMYYDGQPVNLKNPKYLLNHRRKNVGFVVQYFALIEDMNVYDNVALPLKYQKISKGVIRRRVMKALKMLGIEEKAHKYPDELSGGQRQRAAIARAIVKRAELILADEPTGALDEATGIEVMRILEDLKEHGTAVVVVTHDKKIAEWCDRIVYLKDGKNV